MASRSRSRNVNRGDYVTKNTPLLGTDTSWISRIPHFGAVPDLGEKLPDITGGGSGVFDFAMGKGNRAIQRRRRGLPWG